MAIALIDALPFLDEQHRHRPIFTLSNTQDKRRVPPQVEQVLLIIFA